MVPAAADAADTIPSRSGIHGVLDALDAEVQECRICASLQPHRKEFPRKRGNFGTGYFLAVASPRRLPVLEEALARVRHGTYRRLEDLFYLVHAVRCRPTRSQPPRRAAFRACRAFIELEVRLLRPKLVVAVGASAARSFLGDSFRITHEHAIRTFLPQCAVLPIVEPAPANEAVLANRGLTLGEYRNWITEMFSQLIDDLELNDDRDQ